MYLPFVGGIKVIIWDVYISTVCAVKTCSYNVSGRENVKAAESHKGVCRIWMLYMLVHKKKNKKQKTLHSLFNSMMESQAYLKLFEMSSFWSG